MKRKLLFEAILYPNGWHTRDKMINSGVTIVDFENNNTVLIYVDKADDEWICNTGSTTPIIYNSDTTGITVSTVPYIGGTSAYTYQLNIRNQNHADVTNECSFVSKNTQVASVSSGGLITGVYTGSTLISVIHPDLLPVQVSSNTFIVNQIVTSITPYVTSIIGGTGLTYSALTYKDQWNNTIISNNVTRSGYNTGMITSIDQTGGTMYFGYTGSTSITATPTYAPTVTPAVTTVIVTVDGNPLTTGITISTIPYIGGTSAYTYQMVVTDNNGNDVTAECTYAIPIVKKNVATVTANGGLITGVYNGFTSVSVSHPDMTESVASNIFFVKQIVRSMAPYTTSILGGTGLTYSALTYIDQSGSTIPSTQINRTGYNTGIVTITSSSGLLTFGYTGSTSILASGSFGGVGLSASTTSVLVTVDGNPLTTGLTIATIPIIISGDTNQMSVIDNNGIDVTNECAYTSNNTSVAIVNSTGLVTGYGAGSTTIIVTDPDMSYGVSSNTFTVAVPGKFTLISAVTYNQSNPYIYLNLANTTLSYSGMGVLPIHNVPSPYWTIDFGTTLLTINNSLNHGITYDKSTFLIIETTGTAKHGTISITAKSATMANGVNSKTLSIVV